jgi:hypothetical protein
MITGNSNISIGGDNLVDGLDNQVTHSNGAISMLSNGNVGIGTTSPAALLHVAGNILSNGFTSIIARTSVTVLLSGGLSYATPAYTNSTWINGTRAMYLFVMSAIDFGTNGTNMPYAGIALFAPQNFYMVAFSTAGVTSGVNTCNFAGGVIELTGTTTITLSYYQRTSFAGGTTAPFNFSIYAI